MERKKRIFDRYVGWFPAVAVAITLHISHPAQALPANFLSETVQDGFNSPTDVEFAANGLVFVAEMAGTVRVIDNGQLLTAPFIDISSQCNLSENRGLPDNPFFDGNPNSNRSKVYDLGLRNPYRFTIDPHTNTPWIGDVGWATWEEVNSGRGQDFGWPCYEGGNGANLRTGGYESLDQCATYYGNNNPAPPIISWNRSGAGGAALAGPIYTGAAYPASFADARFYADYVQGWIKYQTPDSQIFDFANGIQALVDLELGPDGNVYYLNFISGELKRFIYDPDSAGQSFTASLRSLNSDKCAGVPGGSNVDGRQLLQSDCSGAQGQVFDFRPISAGYNIVVANIGKGLDISGRQTASGAAVIQWPCHGYDDQLWRINPGGSGMP